MLRLRCSKRIALLVAHAGAKVIPKLFAPSWAPQLQMSNCLLQVILDC